MNSSVKIPWIDVGLLDFNSALLKQRQIHKQCVEGKITGSILVVEHPNTLTLGKNSGEDDLLHIEEHYKTLGIEVVKTDRGGRATVHMPGQLVVYPILKILELGMFPKQYVSFLENSVIKLLKLYDVDAYVDPKFPGVWVNNKKVCAIGIRIEDRVSMHGLSLNINNSFDLYDHVIACGIKDRGITNLKEIKGIDISMDKVKSNLKAIMKENLPIIE